MGDDNVCVTKLIDHPSSLLLLGMLGGLKHLKFKESFPEISTYKGPQVNIEGGGEDFEILIVSI